MRQSVRNAFHDFSAPLEGRDVPFFYLDYRKPPLRCLVTIWLGNLCPLSMAITLPMVHPDGRLATKSEIAAAWNLVDERQDLGKHGGMVFGGMKGNELRLPKEAGEAMVTRKLNETDRTLRGMFSDWDDWPACAQLAVISWAWAVGPASPYPRMLAALRAGDFAAASTECDVTPKRGTIVTRNECNRVLLLNAGRVRDYHLDPDMLDWTHVLGVSDVPTVPALDNPPSEPTHAASSPTIAASPLPESVTGSGGIVHVDPARYRDGD